MKACTCVCLYAFLLIIKDISVGIWIKPHIAVLFPTQFLCPSVLNAPLCFDFFWLFISVCQCGCVIECVTICTLKKRRWGRNTDGPSHIFSHLVSSLSHMRPLTRVYIKIRFKSVVFLFFFCTNACTYHTMLVPFGADRRTVQQDTAGMDSCHGWSLPKWWCQRIWTMSGFIVAIVILMVLCQAAGGQL